MGCCRRSDGQGCIRPDHCSALISVMPQGGAGEEVETFFYASMEIGTRVQFGSKAYLRDILKGGADL